MARSALLAVGILASTVSALPFEHHATRLLGEGAVAPHRRNALASWKPSSPPAWTPSAAPSWTPTSAAAPSWTPTSAAAWTPSSAPSWIPSAAPPQTPSSAASAIPSSAASSAPLAAAQSPKPSKPNKLTGSDGYVTYTGNGSIADGWPAQSSWLDFKTMWKNNQPLISTSCTQFNQANNSPKETTNMLDAIKAISSSTSVDARFILAVILQESNGCVRVPTTSGAVLNPGLMQSFQGTGTCNNAGTGVTPCPASEITQMVKDGTAGTPSGHGLVQDLATAGTSGVSRYYMAARIYNSGSIPSDGDLSGPGATACYASDIANRLTGYVKAQASCNL